MSGTGAIYWSRQRLCQKLIRAQHPNPIRHSRIEVSGTSHVKAFVVSPTCTSRLTSTYLSGSLPPLHRRFQPPLSHPSSNQGRPPVGRAACVSLPLQASRRRHDRDTRAVSEREGERGSPCCVCPAPPSSHDAFAGAPVGKRLFPSTAGVPCCRALGGCPDHRGFVRRYRWGEMSASPMVHATAATEAPHSGGCCGGGSGSDGGCRPAALLPSSLNLGAWPWGIRYATGATTLAAQPFSPLPLLLLPPHGLPRVPYGVKPLAPPPPLTSRSYPPHTQPATPSAPNARRRHRRDRHSHGHGHSHRRRRRGHHLYVSPRTVGEACATPISVPRRAAAPLTSAPDMRPPADGTWVDHRRSPLSARKCLPPLPPSRSRPAPPGPASPRPSPLLPNHFSVT